MRVLIASDPFPPKIDGVSDTASMISKGLTALGHSVSAIAPGPGPASVSGARVVRIPAFPLPLYPELRIAWRLDRIRKAVSKTRPDACVVLSPGPVGISVLRALPREIPVANVYTTDIPHYLRSYRLGMLSSPSESLLQWMARRSIATLCPTETVRAELASRGYPRLQLWGRGVDGDLFHPARASESMRWRLRGGDVEKPLVLYVGRLAREKQLDVLLAAARKLPGFRFALVGDGPQRDDLERRFATVPAVFTGYLRGPELAAAFASADVFAFPSASETFGQVVVQAMSCGLPPVVVRGTAPAELIGDEVSGITFAQGDADGLAEAIRAITGDPSRHTNMRQAARDRSLEFSWAELMERLVDMLAVNSPQTGIGAGDAA
jgi:glycosyltransferase involved in cell wall biosynthesis